ncbi:hypothetical protein GGR54DRAFT_470551 [Hypoxylon sp. NC1633]|nr:hypothetical protein GGR54DRAFT_470551 [Hypoxylon sp. NC1633]
MSIDIRDISSDNVERLTRLLSRRPEYGVAIPSRRWLIRQEEKMESLPSEVLRTSNLLKRFVIKLADAIDAKVFDPRAVLCKTHTALNPWLIRSLFLTVAYEATVHTDFIRSWKDRKEYPMVSAFISRIDGTAALWTEPDLYHQCYGTPPFENHMIFVRSGCEACILSAIGANARLLADLRAVLFDRVERRSARSASGRRARDPRLTRYVERWIDHLGAERAAKCRAISDEVLVELRNCRPRLLEWRRQHRRERRPVYTELRSSRDGHRLSDVPSDEPRRRRTKHGIPVAMTNPEDAEEQRRAANLSRSTGATSIYRPDSINGYSQFGHPQTPAYDPTNEYVDELPDDFEDEEGHEDLERDFEEEERSRSKVREWYTSRLSQLNAGPKDDTKSVISMMHPAFQPREGSSHTSAARSAAPSTAPSPLHLRRDRPASEMNGVRSEWTDATVYTADPSIANHARSRSAVPPVPRIPSPYRQSTGSTRPRATSVGHPPSQNSNSRRSNPGSSVYSEQVPPTSGAPRTNMGSSVYSQQTTPTARPPRGPRGPPPVSMKPMRRYLFNGSTDAGSFISSPQRPSVREPNGVRNSARQDNPFANETRPRSASGVTSGSRHMSPAPSMSSSRSATRHSAGGSIPPTPLDEDEWRASWGIRPGARAREGTVLPDDSVTTVNYQPPSVSADNESISPWGDFARR